MKNVLIIILLFVNILAIDLEDLDKQRVQINEGFVQVNIDYTNKKGKTSKKKYDVLRQDSKNSLIIFAHASEKGSLIVKEQNNMYIKTGRSRRAVKISPIQRLVGDSSVGDILELRFKNYYKIASKEKNILNLEALNDSSTYAKIKIYLKNDKLIKSDLFSYSGKKLKTLFYQKTTNSKYIDKYKFVSSKGESIVLLSNYQPKKLPNKLFKKKNIANLYQLSKRYRK